VAHSIRGEKKTLLSSIETGASIEVHLLMKGGLKPCNLPPMDLEMEEAARR
jgi:hypothetical protein